MWTFVLLFNSEKFLEMALYNCEHCDFTGRRTAYYEHRKTHVGNASNVGRSGTVPFTGLNRETVSSPIRSNIQHNESPVYEVNVDPVIIHDASFRQPVITINNQPNINNQHTIDNQHHQPVLNDGRLVKSADPTDELVYQLVSSVRQFVKNADLEGGEKFIRDSKYALAIQSHFRRKHDQHMEERLQGMNSETQLIDNKWDKLKQELQNGFIDKSKFDSFQRLFALIHEQTEKKKVLILIRFLNHAIDRANFQASYVLDSKSVAVRLINETLDKIGKEKHSVLSAPQVSTANLGSKSVLEALKHESVFVQFVLGLVFLFGVYHASTFLLPFFMWSSSAIQEIVKNIKWW